MAKAKSVEDVVLGEALAGNWEDMLGIVSTIENRSRQLGVSYENVVQNQNEFNAYNKALPPGVDKHRAMARQAIEQVKTQGPVHNATFYATPAAVGGLPKDLAYATETPGHRFFTDPKKRAIGTAVGYKTPDVSRQMAALPDVGPVPESRLGGLLSSTTAYSPEASPAPSQFDSLLGQPATASAFNFSPPSSKTRNMAVQPELTGLVQGAVSRLGPEYGWETTSGGQPAKGTSDRRTGSTRHDHGMAIDGTVTRDGVSLNPVDDRQEYMDTLTNLAEAGVGGLGHYGWGIHADVKSPNTWGPDTTSSTLDPGFGLAIDQGRKLSHLDGNYPTPVSRDAPVGAVERGQSLPDLSPSQTNQTGFSAPVGTVERAGALPDVQRGLLGGPPASINGPISMPDQGPTFAAPEKAKPAPVDMAAMAAQYGAYRPGTVPKNLIDLELRQIAPPAAVAPPPAAVTPPAQIAPQQVQRQAPAIARPAPAPSFTGQDVWDGKAQSGTATNGNAMSRNPDGTVSMTSSKYGYTETMNPDGSYRSTNAPGLLGIDAAANSLFGGIGQNRQQPGIQGPLGQPGIQTSQPGFMGISKAKTDLGSGVRGTGGAIAGGMLGGLLGPIGGLLGSFLGGQIAQGKNPLGGLLSQNPQQTFQRGYTPGLAFPDMPEGATSQGDLTAFGEAAARGEYGGQAEHAANNPGGGLY